MFNWAVWPRACHCAWLLTTSMMPWARFAGLPSTAVCQARGSLGLRRPHRCHVRRRLQGSAAAPAPGQTQHHQARQLHRQLKRLQLLCCPQASVRKDQRQGVQQRMPGQGEQPLDRQPAQRFLPACYLHPGGAAGWPQLHQPTVRQTPTPACLLQCAKDTSRWACGTKSATVCAKECLAAKAATTSSTACRCTAEKKPVCAVGGRVFDGPCAAKVSRHENVGGLLRNLSHLVLVLGPKVGGRTGHPELAA